jgi:UDP-3-O-[3-hydroxymyristoyl] glucosamine N-acyltransferase
VQIGQRCRIEPFAFVGANVVIGNDVAVASHVTLQNCRIGSDVVIHTGVRVGQVRRLSFYDDNGSEDHSTDAVGTRSVQDGFGFNLAASGDHSKKPQELLVEIHDHVEIGANSTIDRGSWRNTVLGKGCKLDNLIQIGHNVQLGSGCVIAAQTGIAGSTTVGINVHIGGQVGIAQHLVIGDNVRIAAKSGVMHDLPSDKTYGGSPAVPLMEFRRQMAFMRSAGKKQRGKEMSEN